MLLAGARLTIARRRVLHAAGCCSSRLTDVPGSSGYVRGGVVAYSNDVKTALCRRAGGADRRARRGQRTGRGGDGRGHSRAHRRRRWQSAITGIAGPGGGTERSLSAPSRSPWRRRKEQRSHGALHRRTGR